VDLCSQDVNAEQKKNVENIATTIRDSGLRNVVLLSSWGAEVPDRIGGILGCHWLEQLLDGIPGLNAVRLRPVWFMENFLFNIGFIKIAGINGLPNLRYIDFPEDIFRKGLIGSGGLSPNAADLLIETSQHINSERLKAEPRSKSNTTATTLEEFAETTFAPAFMATPDVSISDRLGGLFLRSFLHITGHRAA
jgi:hypothetical protein